LPAKKQKQEVNIYMNNNTSKKKTQQSPPAGGAAKVQAAEERCRQRDLAAQQKKQDKYESRQKDTKRAGTLDKELNIWLEKKQDSQAVANRLSGLNPDLIAELWDEDKKIPNFIKRANRMHFCADTIQSEVCHHCALQYVQKVEFCRDRFCPICSWRRSRRMAQKLYSIIEICEQQDIAAGLMAAQYIFLTLTVRNVDWPNLNAALAMLQEAWKRMQMRLKRLEKSAITGFFRTLEVTVSKRDGSAHPHLHILIQVKPEYFSKDSGFTYITKEEFVKMWMECLQECYRPVVDVRAVKGEDELKGSVQEVVKYITKDSDLLKLSERNFIYDLCAMQGVRVMSSGGRLRMNEASVEEFLHPKHEKEELHPKGLCGVCGGKLEKVVRKWDVRSQAYHIAVDVSMNAKGGRAGFAACGDDDGDDGGGENANG
jgi:plasmid rolling circle replication initiator protein Rep